MSRVPPFDDEFLESTAVSLRKRTKALGHLVPHVDISKVYDAGTVRRERLEVSLSGYQSNNPTLRMHVWPDRWVWVDARELSKRGWVWAWTYEGRLLGDRSGRDLVATLENSYHGLSNMDGTRTHELTALWKPLLARGPVEIR